MVMLPFPHLSRVLWRLSRKKKVLKSDFVRAPTGSHSVLNTAFREGLRSQEYYISVLLSAAAVLTLHVSPPPSLPCPAVGIPI